MAPITNPPVHRYRITLVRQQEGTVAEPVVALAGLAVGADGYVRCYADGARLAQGSYLLRMQPDANTQSVAEIFPFNLHPQATGPSR